MSGPQQAPAIHPTVIQIIDMVAAVTNKPTLAAFLKSQASGVRATKLAQELSQGGFVPPMSNIKVIQNLQSQNPTIPPALQKKYDQLPVAATTEELTATPQPAQATLPAVPTFSPEGVTRQFDVIAEGVQGEKTRLAVLALVISSLKLKDGDRELSAAEIEAIVKDPEYWNNPGLAEQLINGLQTRKK